MISLLYHPPLLDERGLAWALHAMVEGFGRRTDLRTTMLLDYASHRVTVREATLYRVAQEALANVHRHARAEQVDVLLIEARGALHLLVQDDGIGLGAGSAGGTGMGVGIAAMHERLRDVGGRLAIRSWRAGTSVIASVPLDDAEPMPR